MFKRLLLNNNLGYCINSSLLECSSCSTSASLKGNFTFSFLKSANKVRLCTQVTQNPVPKTSQYVDAVVSNKESRLIKVAIIGVPNAGKSTIINELVGQQVCPASSKVHTTRFRVRAVVNDGKTQIVLLDTPGLVGSKQAEMHHLERSFLVDGGAAVQEADAVCVVHDAANKWTREQLDEGVLKLLQKYKDKRSFLVLNKVDILKSKRVLLDLVSILTCSSEKSINVWPHFEQIFMTSGLTGSGIPELKEYLIDIANVSPWMFKPDVTTDQTMESLIVDIVRAALLDNLPQEIPYRIKPEIEHLHESLDGTIRAVVLLGCSMKRVERMVMGSKGWRIRKIARDAEQHLQSAFNTTVLLNLVVTEAK